MRRRESPASLTDPGGGDAATPLGDDVRWRSCERHGFQKFHPDGTRVTWLGRKWGHGSGQARNQGARPWRCRPVTSGSALCEIEVGAIAQSQVLLSTGTSALRGAKPGHGRRRSAGRRRIADRPRRQDSASRTWAGEQPHPDPSRRHAGGYPRSQFWLAAAQSRGPVLTHPFSALAFDADGTCSSSRLAEQTASRSSLPGRRPRANSTHRGQPETAVPRWACHRL